MCLTPIITHVVAHADDFIHWPQYPADLVFPGVVRDKYHNDLDANVLNQIRAAQIPIDRRSNGPAIMSYLLSGGDRPQGWNIHHIYFGEHPHMGMIATIHAVHDGQHFTRSAGVVAIHPVAHALAHASSSFSWWLRAQANVRFGYNPDGVRFHDMDWYLNH